MDMTEDFSKFVDDARAALDRIDRSVGKGICLYGNEEFTKEHVDKLMRAVIVGLLSLELMAKVGTICEKED